MFPTHDTPDQLKIVHELLFSGVVEPWGKRDGDLEVAFPGIQCLKHRWRVPGATHLIVKRLNVGPSKPRGQVQNARGQIDQISLGTGWPGYWRELSKPY